MELRYNSPHIFEVLIISKTNLTLKIDILYRKKQRKLRNPEFLLLKYLVVNLSWTIPGPYLHFL